MWPLIMAVLRRNAVYITLPVAALVGVIGYNIEGLLSDKYTPYIRPTQENRAERLAQNLEHPEDVEKLHLQGNFVLERNLSPSLKAKQ